MFVESNKMLSFLCLCANDIPMSPAAKRPGEVKRFGSQLALSSEHDALSLAGHNINRHR